ncbi:hypothetical protein D9M72_490680 [compost metagenome]
MIGDDRAAALKQEVARATRFRLADDRDTASHRESEGMRKLEVGTVVDECARHGDDMGRNGRLPQKSRLRQIADIAVEIGFDPGPALGRIKHPHALAIEHLGVRAAGGVRAGTERRDRHGERRHLSLDITLRLDLAAKRDFGEIAAIGVETTVRQLRHG